MSKLIWVLLLVFCLVAAEGRKKVAKSAKIDDEQAPAEPPSEGEEGEEENSKLTVADDEEGAEGEQKAEIEEEDSSDDDGSADDTKQFSCNLKFKKVGCYADKSKSKKPLKSFIMSDADMGDITKRGKLPNGDTFNTELPKFACKCANEAMNSGNAIFGIQNIAECWTGPDNSKYDKDGPSEDCVTFDYTKCAADSELCAGKKHANFVYFVDAPEHTKTQEEVQKELAAAAAKKKKEQKKKGANKKKSKKSKGKKSKKAKKE